MPLTTTSFKALRFLQRFKTEAYKAELIPSSYCLKNDPRYLKNICMLFYSAELFSLFFQVSSRVVRLLWLYSHWKTFTIYNMEQGIIILIFALGTFIFILLLCPQHPKRQSLVEMVNQSYSVVISENQAHSFKTFNIPLLGTYSSEQCFVQS